MITRIGPLFSRKSQLGERPGRKKALPLEGRA